MGYEPYEEAIIKQAEHNMISISKACCRFGEVRLRVAYSDKDQIYNYHPYLGIYSKIEEEN